MAPEEIRVSAMRSKTYGATLLLTFGALASAFAAHGCREQGAPTPMTVASNGGAATDAGATAANGANGVKGTSDAANAALAKLPKLAVVMQDPRSAGARDQERAKNPAAAAKALEDAALANKLDDRTMSNWTYVEGRLHLAANDPAETKAAAPELDKAADDPELSPYASLRASQAYARLGQFSEALTRAEAARGRTKLDDEELVALAEALAGTGDRASAIPLWRATLTAHPHGSRWVDSALRLADALLDQMSIPGATYDARPVHEARDLATRVMVEAPKVADALGAPALRMRAVTLEAAHGEHDSPDISPDSMIRRAQAWLDSSDPAHALDAANLATKNVKMDTPSPLACKASILRAQAAAKLKGKDKALASKLGDDPWGTAIAACDHEETLVTALSSGAKASATSKRTNEALDRYALLEKRFPAHRLADDARYQSALLVQSDGDEAKAYDLFVSLADAYPNGDMKGEALFRAALIRIVHGDWEAAKVPLDRAVALDPHDRHWASAERAMYFRARAAAATGDAEGAREGYRGVIAGAPLSFYMMQAYARLHAIDANEAERALASAVARDEGGVFPSHEHPELASLPFRRACRLLEVGELEAAKREFAAIGGAASAAAAPSSAPANVQMADAGAPDAGDGDASSSASPPGLSISPDGASDPELTWIVAWLFDTSGSPELGHSYVRGKLTDFLAHYPVGSWRVPWEVAFPRAYGDLVERESTARSIPPALTWAIMREESGFYPDAKSGANAFGLMQLVPPTARGLGKSMNLPTDDASLVKPDISVALGARLLSQLRGQFSREPALAIAAYNAGGGAVGRWIGQRRGDDFDLFVERIPYDETRGYEKRVLASEAAYGYLYDRAAFDETVSLASKVE